MFLALTSLALPRFFEIILPLSVSAATLFLYNRMTVDTELTVMRTSGYSPFALAWPGIMLGMLVTVVLWGVTMWLAPVSLAKMQHMRQSLQAEFSTLLFREGVFNRVGKGLTVYIRKREKDGSLAGLMIHDMRDTTAPPSTVLARRGVIAASDEEQQVIVFNGARQVYDPESGILQRLAFDRYTIDLPEAVAARKRWAQPDERTIAQLFNPDPGNARDMENLREFSVEIHRRFTSPLLALAFPLVALAILLSGPVDRRGQSVKIALAVILVILIQGFFLASYNLARNHNAGLVLMYVLTCVPLFTSLFMLGPLSRNLKKRCIAMMRSTTSR